MASFSASAQTPTTTPANPPAPTISTAPAMPPEQPAQEIVANPYSLTALWQGGDVIARSTIVILAIMSISTWYVLITKFAEQAFLLRQGREASRKFWNAVSIHAGADSLGRNSAFRVVVEDGLKAAEHHEGKLTEQIDRHSWITLSLQRSVDSISNRLQGGLAVLATVGSTAPFVGLFGTVWGIYHALTAIGIAGQASIDKVAGPVGEALIMTAIGLAVAVPAVLAYNWMVRRNKVAMDQVRGFSSDLLALLIGGTAAVPKPAMRSA
jgi:biopolymer transport protein ExbB